MDFLISLLVIFSVEYLAISIYFKRHKNNFSVQDINADVSLSKLRLKKKNNENMEE